MLPRQTHAGLHYTYPRDLRRAALFEGPAGWPGKHPLGSPPPAGAEEEGRPGDEREPLRSTGTASSEVELPPEGPDHWPAGAQFEVPPELARLFPDAGALQHRPGSLGSM